MLKRRLDANSVSGIAKTAYMMLGKLDQTPSVVSAMQLIKRVPYLYRTDVENGTDRAHDAAGKAMDILVSAVRRHETDGIKPVIRIIDDIVSIL